jgi:hypothetical protein
VLTRRESEIWIDGDEFGWQPRNGSRLGPDFTFTDEEKAGIAAIAPLVWDFMPHFRLKDWRVPEHITLNEPRGQAWIRAKCYVIADLIADGLFPEATHMGGHWLIWDTAEQDIFLRENAASLSMAQYALMRGFETPKAGETFLHSFAERAGCEYVTHFDVPDRCWGGDYRQSMASYLAHCDALRKIRNEAMRAAA